MNQIYKVFLLIGLLICFSCSKSEDVPEEKIDNRTILVYLAAENSLQSFALDDYEEMLVGMESVSDDNNLLVYVDVRTTRDGTKALPRLYRISRNPESGKIEESLVYEYPVQDDSSVKVERMTDVFQRAFKAYPAQSYGLVLWSHGDGWLPTKSALRSFGQDGGNYGPNMDIPELEKAVSIGTTMLGNASKFDFIYFDACFMQGIEVAYQFKNYTDHIIACPMETPGPGSPYDLVLAPLFEKGKADVLGMAQKYYDTYASIYDLEANGGNSYWTYGVAISVVETSGLDYLAEVSRSLYQNHKNELMSLQEDDLSAVQKFDNGRTYSGSYKHAYYDFGDMVKQVVSKEEYAKWQDALNQAVPYKATTPTCYSVYLGFGGGNVPIIAFSGLSAYFPYQNNEDYVSWNKFYYSLAWGRYLAN